MNGLQHSMFKQEASNSTFLSKFKLMQPQQEQVIDIMDEGLAYIMKAIDMNIEIQELIIEIKRKKIKSEMDALLYIHKMRDNHQSLMDKYRARMPEFIERQEPPVMKDGIGKFTQQPPNFELYTRFYGRINQKVFSKFVYYSINHKSLQFTTGSLLSLFQLTVQMKNQPSHQFVTMTYFNRLISFILDQNETFHALLLDLIVSENYVSSCDQFLYLKGDKQFFKSVINQAIEEQQQSQDGGAKPTSSGSQAEKPRPRKGNILQGAYKRKIEALANKFHDKVQRELFMTNLSHTIKREIEAIEQFPEQERMFKRMQKRGSTNQVGQRITMSTLLANNSIKRGSSRGKRLHIQDPEIERVKKVSEKKEDQQLSMATSKSGPRISKQDLGDFFVGTHALNILSKNTSIKEQDHYKQNNSKPKVFKYLNLTKAQNDNDSLNKSNSSAALSRAESKTFTFVSTVKPVKKQIEFRRPKKYGIADCFSKSLGPILRNFENMNMISSPKGIRSSQYPLSTVSRGLDSCMKEFLATLDVAARKYVKKSRETNQLATVKLILNQAANILSERKKREQQAVQAQKLVSQKNNYVGAAELEGDKDKDQAKKNEIPQTAIYKKRNVVVNRSQSQNKNPGLETNLRSNTAQIGARKHRQSLLKRELYHIHMRKIVGSYS